MLDISHEQAYERAYRLKKHQLRLKEIKSKSKNLDNQLSSLYFPIPKRHGYKQIWWSEKVNRENQILLEKLIKIKQKIPQYTRPLLEARSCKAKDFSFENDETFLRIANVNPSLSTKHLLKDYSKHKKYSEMRSKIINHRIVSFKNLEKSKHVSLKNIETSIKFENYHQD